MSVKRMVVDLPAEIYQDFKVNCVKNKVQIKDQILGLILNSLNDKIQQDKEPEKIHEKKYILINGETVVDDLC